MLYAACYSYMRAHEAEKDIRVLLVTFLCISRLIAQNMVRHMMLKVFENFLKYENFSEAYDLTFIVRQHLLHNKR